MKKCISVRSYSMAWLIEFVDSEIRYFALGKFGGECGNAYLQYFKERNGHGCRVPQKVQIWPQPVSKKAKFSNLVKSQIKS